MEQRTGFVVYSNKPWTALTWVLGYLGNLEEYFDILQAEIKAILKCGSQRSQYHNYFRTARPPLEPLTPSPCSDVEVGIRAQGV